MSAKAIVAATDGSGESLRAVEWAAREAMLRSVPLRIVSAASLPKMVVLQLRPERDACDAGDAAAEEGQGRADPARPGGAARGRSRWPCS